MNTSIEERYIWLGGEIVHLTEAKINVLAPTSQFGANVFEGIRCYWNNKEQQLYAFRLEEHYKRLQDSIKLFQLTPKYSTVEMQKYMIDVVKANNYKEDIAVRQTVFVDGFGTWSSKEPINMFIAPIPKKRNVINNDTGLRCGISSWLRISDRNMSPRAKVGANYINSRIAQLEAMEHGYDSAIFMNENGKIAEGPGSCLFMIKDDVLITPPITASVLDSITRKTIIQLAQEVLHLSVIERDIDRTELYISDEIFLCGSAMEIMPVINVDGYKINKAKCGKITKEIHELYIEVVVGKRDEYKYWLTEVY